MNKETLINQINQNLSTWQIAEQSNTTQANVRYWLKKYNLQTIRTINKESELKLCPKCNTPGFGVVETVKGLPCEMCGLPTRSTLKHIYRCQKCNYQIAKEFPFDKRVESPQFCDYCNP